MSPIEPFFIVTLSGAAGGVINAIITDNGFILPREESSEKASIIIPGIIANLLIGAAAGFLYWGLTESNSLSVVYGPTAPGVDEIKVTVYGVAMSLLAGMAGARYLTNEVDKRLLKAAAVTAAASGPSDKDAQMMAKASPLQMLQIAKSMMPGARRDAKIALPESVEVKGY